MGASASPSPPAESDRCGPVIAKINGVTEIIEITEITEIIEIIGDA